jgi:tetratricopeptide (TPR) repeat protein
MPKDALKMTAEALQVSPQCSKAHYRAYLAHKQLNDLDQAKVSLEQAILLEPSDRQLRHEFKQLTESMQAKRKEWFSKMSGFYNNNKLSKIEQQEESYDILREKVERQLFS